MSTFEIRIDQNPKDLNEPLVERLKLTMHTIEGYLRVYTGQQGEHIVSIVPSLNVSGYGQTEIIAWESLKENLETLFDDLFELTEIERRKELTKMGWTFETIFKRRLSNTSLDENGILENFDFPDQVKRSILQAA